MTDMPKFNASEWLLDDETFDLLEALLVSEQVPEDCMDLEMLDGFLAAIVASPLPIEARAWLPSVWSAHAHVIKPECHPDPMRAVTLVMHYYNELVATIGRSEEWEPFCYAEQPDQGLSVGEEWAQGFEQGLEFWPDAWSEHLPEAVATAAQDQLQKLFDTRDDLSALPGNRQELQRLSLAWMEEARNLVHHIAVQWEKNGLARPRPIEAVEEAVAALLEV